jgi:hypothetical protein
MRITIAMLPPQLLRASFALNSVVGGYTIHVIVTPHDITELTLVAAFSQQNSNDQCVPAPKTNSCSADSDLNEPEPTVHNHNLAVRYYCRAGSRNQS